MLVQRATDTNDSFDGVFLLCGRFRHRIRHAERADGLPSGRMYLALRLFNQHRMVLGHALEEIGNLSVNKGRFEFLSLSRCRIGTTP